MKKILLICLSFSCLTAKSQNDRVADHNNITWLQTFVTIPLNKKFDLLTEYQWRRADGLKNWQQSLLRGAIQYKLSTQVSVAAGYGWIKTFPYGDFPVAANGSFPEHRLYEQVQLKQALNKFSLTHRFRIEQRWIGRKISGSDKVEDYLFSHRFRYLSKLQLPISVSGKIYAAIADEIFIAAGKNVGVNVFDQNRLMVTVGTKLNSHVSIDLSYINQILIQGRRINNNTIVQHNNGITLAALFSL